MYEHEISKQRSVQQCYATCSVYVSYSESIYFFLQGWPEGTSVGSFQLQSNGGYSPLQYRSNRDLRGPGTLTRRRHQRHL